jgi:hypothetical protein
MWDKKPYFYSQVQNREMVELPDPAYQHNIRMS